METSTGQTSDAGGWAGHASISQQFRRPRATDGVRVHDLIARCDPLDANSLYCNLLQCTQFAETSVIVERDEAIVGWVSGYVRPDRQDTLFIWQVAVAPEARGLGLGGRMVREILARDACERITKINTTVTASNAPSRALFRRLAESLGASLAEYSCFDDVEHFGGRNPAEYLIEITSVSGGLSGR